MQATMTIGLDIAKSVFQVHNIDAEGKVVIDPAIRTPPLPPGIVKCGLLIGI